MIFSKQCDVEYIGKRLLLTFMLGCVILFRPMADVAQLVRALVCGTRCREFESHLPPQFLFWPPFRMFIFLWALMGQFRHQFVCAVASFFVSHCFAHQKLPLAIFDLRSLPPHCLKRILI